MSNVFNSFFKKKCLQKNKKYNFNQKFRTTQTGCNLILLASLLHYMRSNEVAEDEKDAGLFSSCPTCPHHADKGPAPG